MRKQKSVFMFLGLFFLGCFTSQVHAQEDKGDLETRTTYIHQHYISKYRFWLRNYVSTRQGFGDDSYTRVLLRPRAIIELTSILEFIPAVDFRYTYYYGNPQTMEIRTWEGIRLHWPDVGRVMFDHFYRFEQRFFWTEGQRDEAIGLRSRYRLNMRIPLNNRTMTENTYFLDTRAEIFVPHDDEIQELHTSRLQFGMVLGYRQNNKWRYLLSGYFDTGWNTVEDVRTINRYIIELAVRTNF